MPFPENIICPNGCQKPRLKDNRQILVDGEPEMEPARLTLTSATRLASELDCCLQCSVCGFTKNFTVAGDGTIFVRGEQVTEDELLEALS